MSGVVLPKSARMSPAIPATSVSGLPPARKKAHEFRSLWSRSMRLWRTRMLIPANFPVFLSIKQSAQPVMFRNAVCLRMDASDSPNPSAQHDGRTFSGASKW